MSRAKEIKEKLALQAKIQLSFSNQSDKVLNWLKDEIDEDSEPKDTSTIQKEQTDFFKLPVMQIGSGLNMDNDAPDVTDNQQEENSSRHTDIHTVGEFIKSDKKVQSLSKKKQYKLNKPHEQRTNTIHRIAKDDTKAMISLKRKLKQQNRDSIKSSIADDKNLNSDSDSDSDALQQKTRKKNVGLLFQGKKRK